ncbi:hypothetical protein [Nocardia amamiensis]|nr:hypothetical protein [Nocardia amamiensis]
MHTSTYDRAARLASHRRLALVTGRLRGRARVDGPDMSRADGVA